MSEQDERRKRVSEIEAHDYEARASAMFDAFPLFDVPRDEWVEVCHGLYDLLTAIRQQNASLLDLLSIASNTCSDVTKLGRFAPSVDPVRWVEQLKAHLDAALTEPRREEERE